MCAAGSGTNITGPQVTVDGNVTPTDPPATCSVGEPVAETTGPIQTETAPSPSSAPPAYATGTCSFHLTETETCLTDDKNLHAIFKLVDNNTIPIGETVVDDQNRLGAAINDATPYSFESKLPSPS